MLKDQILSLLQQGKTRPEIQKLLNCSKSTICYHLDGEQKEKSRLRSVKRRHKHPYIKKLENFKDIKRQHLTKDQLHKWSKLIQLKIEGFHKNRTMKTYQAPTFTVKDVIHKFGENPKCYLTGESIDIYKPREYAFDHIHPASLGGKNTIDNLGICTKEANQAKHNLTLEQFYALCEKIIEHRNSSK